jgi:membrane-bound serine protease (ClpP class)
MRKWILSLSLLILLTFSSSVLAVGKTIVLDLTGPIGPATQDYVIRGIAYAEKEQAMAIILQLNTPGGLDSSMRGINEAIINSSIPVITYVYPSGARAASAGLFIMYASHLSAMAPGTNIGAASPVNLLGSYKPTDTKDTKDVSTEEKKVVNDASAYIRSLAQLRDRNVEWAERAVREAVSLSASEAHQLKVVDEIAADYPQLLEKIQGKNILVKGVNKTIDTKSTQLETLSPDWRYKFLAFITNPNIAYMLLLIAIYGLFFELSNPGLVLPGVAGSIALLLVLYAFQLMPINYVGLFLVLLGIAFMVFEVYVSSFGVIGIGGVIAFIIGSIMLFDMHDANYSLSWPLVITMSAITLAFFFMALNLVVRSQRNKPVSGKEGLIGSHGIVINVADEQITVRVLGEIWQATSSHLLKVGDIINVTRVNGLVLNVEPIGKRK